MWERLAIACTVAQRGTAKPPSCSYQSCTGVAEEYQPSRWRGVNQSLDATLDGAEAGATKPVSDAMR